MVKAKVVGARYDWTVWVGGSEVNDYYMTKDKALALADEYDDYDDVVVENVRTMECISKERDRW